MAVPKRKKSKSRVAQRRAHHDIVANPPSVVACKNCDEPTLPHRVCPACGFYDGVQVVAQKKKATPEAEA